MGTVLAVAGLVVLALVALIVGVLSLPYVAVFRAETEPRPRAMVELRTFGAGGPRLARLDTTDPPKPRSKPARPEPKGKHRKRGRSRRRSGSGTPPWLWRAMKQGPALLLALLGRFRLLHLRIRGRVGLDDPADTGQAFGLLAAASSVPWSGPVEIDLAPEFSGPTLNGEASLAVRLVPITLLPPLLGFAWSVFVRRA